MYAYALPTPTFTATWGHYSRLSSPIGGGIARGNRGDGSSSTFHAGVSRARGPRRMRDRNLHFHPPSDPHRRGLIIPDRYSLIYENGEREDEIQGSRVLSVPPCPSSLGMFIAIAVQVVWGFRYCFSLLSSGRCSREVEWPRWGFSADCAGRS